MVGIRLELLHHFRRLTRGEPPKPVPHNGPKYMRITPRPLPRIPTRSEGAIPGLRVR